MRSTVLLLTLLAAAAANPVVATFVNEIQVAPDSLERIEIHPHNWEDYPIDLSGWQIVTTAGTAVVNDSVICWDESSYVVLDRSNTTGTLSLGDEQDSISFIDQFGYEAWTLKYPPASSGWWYDYFWRPPSGMSSSLYYSVYVQGMEWFDLFGCYLDATPTFGFENDDTLGGISGRVLDEHGHPLSWCAVNFSSEYGSTYTWCDSNGRYRIWPLGPTAYQVRAHGDSTWLPSYYHDSVRVEPNQMQNSIDITMYPVGVTARTEPRPPLDMFLGGRRLFVAPGRMLLADVTGRTILTGSGGRDYDLGTLNPGAYVVLLVNDSHTLSRKIVLY